MKSVPLERNTCEDIAQILSQVLSNTYVLYTKTQNFHWNLKDPRFYSLHLLFEKQYEELADNVDLVAERMRMIDFPSPGSMREFIELSSLEESQGTLSGDEMIRELYEDHIFCANVLRALVAEIAEMGDQGTSDLFVNLLRGHEKNAWMLKSHFNK